MTHKIENCSCVFDISAILGGQMWGMHPGAWSACSNVRAGSMENHSSPTKEQCP